MKKIRNYFEYLNQDERRAALFSLGRSPLLLVFRLENERFAQEIFLPFIEAAGGAFNTEVVLNRVVFFSCDSLKMMQKQNISSV